MRLLARAVALVAVLVSIPLVAVPPTRPAAAAAELTASKSAPSSVLAGEAVPFTLTAANPGDAPEFNLTFRDVLPLGISYAGPTSPALAGEPRIVENDVEFPPGSGRTVPQQTLIWENVADLQSGDSLAIEFAVALNDGTDPRFPEGPAYPVGATLTNTGEVYASPDARAVPRFDAAGVPIPDVRIDSASASSGTTQVSAIRITKAEPSPEGELLRGVHDFATTYTLTVEVTGEAGVDGVAVTDLLPAELELLACGGVDNSAPGTEEYTGSGRLGVGLADPACRLPDLVETVVDPPAAGGTTYPPGVYTKVTWDLGDLPAGTTVTLPYFAGVPLRANAPFPAPAPDPASGLQAANLDNNTGPSTRETTAEQSVTNVARAAGTYRGPLAPGATAAVADDDRLTRSVEDVRIRKSVAPTLFTQLGRATYTVVVDTGEYASATGIVLTDRLPNGTCPLQPAQNYAVGAPLECQGAGADASTVPVVSAVEDTTDGGFDVTFAPLPDLPAGSTTTVTYYARMRDTYRFGPNDGAPPVSGDSLTNVVTSTATTTDVTAPGGTTATVLDESSATQTTTGMTIDKTILPRQLLGPSDPCPSTGYIEPEDAASPTALDFRLGDRVCFKLRVDFADTISTRDVDVGDFLPVGVEFEVGSVVDTGSLFLSCGSGTEFRCQTVLPGSPGEPVGWRLGEVGAGGARFVEPGAVFEVVFAGRVVDTPDSNVPQVTGNLMKMRATNTDGSAQSFRDQLPFTIVPGPPMTVTKGVQSVDDPPFSTTSPNQDDRQVVEGSVVTYRIDVTNGGTVANGNAFSTRSLDLWDVLPPGVRCSAVSAITNFVDDTGGGPVYGTCTDPGQPGHPTFTLGSVRSAIRWDFPIDDRWDVNAGQTRTLTYQLVIPTPTSQGTRLVNTAHIRSYDAFSNTLGETATYLPADNIDSTVTPDRWNVPAASDPSAVLTPGARVTKTGTTSIEELPPPNGLGGNNRPNQAVPGELVTYRYSVVVPAATSVFEATLTDAFTTNAARIELLTSPAPLWRFYPDAASTTTGSQPPGFTLSSTGTLTFPETYTNSTATEQRFEVEIVGRIRNTFATLTSNLDNTATFTSFDRVGGAPVVTPPAGYRVSMRQPSPTLQKTVSDAVVVGGDVVTYTLTASNASGRPPMYDSWLEDCIPAGLTFDSFATGTPVGSTIGPVAGDVTNGCASTATYVAFRVGSLAGGQTVVRAYDVTVDLTAVGGERYTNSAELTGSSLDDDKAVPTDPDNPAERTYRVPDSVDVRVPGAGVTKSVAPDRATIGETVTYTISATVPANASFYQAALRDTLPPGIDPTSITLTGSDCERLGDPAPCPIGPTLLGPVAQPGGGALAAWYVGDIPADPFTRVYTLTYTARVADVPGNAAGSTVRNTVQSFWDLTDSGPGNDPTSPTYPWTNPGSSDSADVTVLEPSLTIAKSVSDTTPEPGDLFTYTVRVSNAAGATVSPAYDLRVVDVVPVGVDVFPASIAAGGSYDPGTRRITWDPTDLPGPLDPGAGIDLTYVARLAPSSGIGAGSLPNTADLERYTSFPTDPRTYVGGSSTATVTPDFPGLTASKVADDGEPTYLGTESSWSITVRNDGTGRAFGVTVLDDLPPSWRYVAGSTEVTAPDGSVTTPEPVTTGLPPQLRWAGLGILEPGEELTVRYRAVPDPGVVVDPGIGSSVRHTNTAEAVTFDATGAAGNRDGDYGSGAVTASTRIDAVDLAIDKLDATPATPPVAGQPFDWTIRVTNLSTTDTAVGPFTVTDPLPSTPGVTFASATGTGWSCTTGSGTVTCTRTNPADVLAPGASFPDLVLRFDLAADLAEGTLVTNTASVAGRTFDTDPTNDTDTDTITVTTSADLRLEKSRTGTVVAGTDSTYTVVVTNLGPSTSRGPITVTDTLPTGTSYVSAAGTGWTCSHDGATTGGAVACTRAADLPLAGVAPAITVTVRVASGTTGSITNAAEITSTATTDPDPTNDRDDDVATVATSADVRIEKRALGALVAGQPAVYRLRVDNGGPSDADGVRITDDLPTGLTFSTAASVTGTWSCAPTPTGFTCDLTGALVAGGSATVDVTVDVASDVVGTIVNTATVTTTTPDPDLTNNTDGDTSPFDTLADLVLTKTSVGNAVAGRPLTWTLLVENLGPSDAQPDVVVTDPLPTSVRFASATGAGWTCTHDGATAGGLVTCRRTAPLPAAPSADRFASPIALVVDVLPDAGPATITNTASVGSATNDPNPGNDADRDDVVVADEVDVSVVKTADPIIVLAGEQLTYTLSIANAGPSDADDVVVADVLPTGLSGVTADGTGWACELPTAQTVRCERATLPAGATSTITVVAAVASAAPDGTVLTNSAQVSTSSPDTNPSNDRSTATVQVAAEADLSITKSHPAGPVLAGEQVTFTVVVANAGPGDAVRRVEVVDTLPAGFSLVSSSGPWACAEDVADPQEITCTLDGPSLPAGTSSMLTITAATDAALDPADVDNVVTVTSPTTDPDPTDNTAVDPVEVAVEASVSITKVHDADAVRVGDVLEFDVRVRNGGPSEARDVEVADTVPTGLELLDADGAGWTCTVVTDTATCALDTSLAPGDEAAPITLRTRVLASAYPEVTNTAVVTTTTPQDTTTDDRADDPVTVPALVDLRITKRHDQPVQVGGTITYTLTVTNAGPTSDPGPIEVRDVLPAALRPLTATGTGSTCTVVAQAVTCRLDAPLAVAATRTVAVTAEVLPTAFPQVENVATVTTPSEQTDTTNDRASDVADVAPLIRLAVDKQVVRQSGRRVEWSITVTNVGRNTTIAPITVTDPLPPGLTLVSVAGDGWSCTGTTTVRCTSVAAVAAGAAASPIRLVTDVVAAPGTDIVNTVVADGGVTCPADGTCESRAEDSASVIAPFPLPATGGDPWLPLRGAMLLLFAGTPMVLAACGRRRGTVTR